jgi:hypothetical protein
MKKPFWNNRVVCAPLWLLWVLLLTFGSLVILLWLACHAIGWCADRLFGVADAIGDSMDFVENKIRRNKP